MRCAECGRKADAFKVDPATPSRLLCSFCAPDGGIDGHPEEEVSLDIATQRHRAHIGRLLEGNEPRTALDPAPGQRVMTTDSFDVKRR